MNFNVVIPARFESTRFPGKLLSIINGQSVIERVVNIARQSGAREIIVATDDQRISECLDHMKCDVILTSENHQSGTDRIAEVANIKKWPAQTMVVNLQGDEPFIPPELVNAVAKALDQAPSASISTACFPITKYEELLDPNLVKLTVDHQNYALYFSRAPMPWARDTFSTNEKCLPDGFVGLGHIGIYGYRVKYLLDYPKLPFSPLENLEKLEQLRALQAGHRIVLAQTSIPPAAGIDTPDDLERARVHASTL